MDFSRLGHQTVQRKENELRKILDAIDAAQKELDYLKSGARKEDYKGKTVVGPSNTETWQSRWEAYPKWRERYDEDLVLSREAEVKRRIRELQRQGKWTDRALLGPSCDPKRNKTKWDYLLEEMEHRQSSVVDERTWKRCTMRTCGRRVQQYHKSRQSAENKKVKDEEAQLRKIAKDMAKGVKKYWEEVEKLIEDRHKMIYDEKNNRLLMRKQQRILANAEELTTELRADLGGEQDAEESEASSSSSLMEEDNEDTLELEEKLAAEEGEQNENELKELEEMAEMDLDLDALRAKLAAMDEDGEYEEAASDAELEEDDDDDEKIQSNKGGENAETGKTMDEKMMQDIIADLKEAEPRGVDLSTTKVKVNVPELMNEKYSLREYQLIGLDWLNTMYQKDLNGILADEMGLGKTVMTIAMLANLACTKEIWGPHLIVVPTSVLLNWEIEFKRFCPSFKVLTYHGSRQYRNTLRKGWNSENTFHVCITSYNLILSDATMFRRKKWQYMILDEAQNIKNWKSKKWETLLCFNTERRLLLTGTPLQNNLMEMWSLLHFLMPDAVAFESNKEFREWFSNPMNDMVTGQSEIDAPLIHRLHSLLRPFILRRLKKDVEKQMPKKYHHVLSCKLSKRQRILYDDFMNLATTKNTISQGSYMGLIGILMSLRKVCNHPDLFEERPIVSPFDQLHPIELHIPRKACKCMEFIEDRMRGLQWLHSELSDSWAVEAIGESMVPPKVIIEEMKPLEHEDVAKSFPHYAFADYSTQLAAKKVQLQQERATLIGRMNALRCDVLTLGISGNQIRVLKELASVKTSQRLSLLYADEGFEPCGSKTLQSMVVTAEGRMTVNSDLLKKFTCYIAAARTRPPCLRAYLPIHYTPHKFRAMEMGDIPSFDFSCLTPYRETFVRTQMYFPDKYLLQYDCGKLQVLARLLVKLKAEGSRVLIFTQMSKMLNVLESFMCMHAHTYLRLDGSTKLEDRQILMERFNNDSRIFCFILSTRSGGIGINLTGANCVVFYDSDWNPAMDLQAQDRCHRIGQTRDVHIYRLISEHTIETNIYKKVQEKKMIVNLTLKGGQFGADFLMDKVNIKDFFHSFDEDMDQDEIRKLQQMAGENTEPVEDTKEQQPAKKANQKVANKAAASDAVQILGAAEIVSEELAPLPEVKNVDFDKDVELAMIREEDEDDRIAYKKAKEETSKELKEFDENFTFTDIDPLDIEVLEEEFSAKLKPLVRRSVEFFTEVYPERVSEIADEYIVEEYDELIGDNQKVVHSSVPCPSSTTLSTSAPSPSQLSSVPSLPEPATFSSSSSTLHPSPAATASSSTSGPCAASSCSCSSSSSSPSPCCTSEKSLPNDGSSNVTVTSNGDVGTTMSLEGNKKRSAVDEEMSANKRLRSIQHPNGRGGEPEGGASPPLDDLPPAQFMRIVTQSYASGVHVLSRLPVPNPIVRPTFRRLAREAKPPDPGVLDDTEEVPLFYETEHANDLLAQYRGIQFDLHDSDIEHFYNHCKDKWEKDRLQRERERTQQQEYVGASDYSGAEESEGAAEEEDDGSAVDHDPRRRARKIRSPTSRDTKRCGARRPDDDPDPLLAADPYQQPERWRRDPRQQEDGVRPNRRVRASRNNGLEQDVEEEQEQETPAAEVDEDPGPRTGGRPGRRPRFPKQRSDDVASPPPPRRRRDDDVAANTGVGEGENAEMVWKDYEEATLLKAVDLCWNKPTGFPQHIPNWDLLCDVLNTTHWPSPTPRAAFQCKAHYAALQQQQQQGVVGSRQKNPEKYREMSASQVQKEAKKQNLRQLWTLLVQLNQPSAGQKTQKSTKRKRGDTYQANENPEVNIWPARPSSPMSSPAARVELRGATPKDLLRKITEKQRSAEQQQRQANINKGQFSHPSTAMYGNQPGYNYGASAHPQPGAVPAPGGAAVSVTNVRAQAHASQSPTPPSTHTAQAVVIAPGAAVASAESVPSSTVAHAPDSSPGPPAGKGGGQSWEPQAGHGWVPPFHTSMQQPQSQGQPHTDQLQLRVGHDAYMMQPPQGQPQAAHHISQLQLQQYQQQAGAQPPAQGQLPPSALTPAAPAPTGSSAGAQPTGVTTGQPPGTSLIPTPSQHAMQTMYAHMPAEQLQQQARLQHQHHQHHHPHPHAHAHAHQQLQQLQAQVQGTQQQQTHAQQQGILVALATAAGTHQHRHLQFQQQFLQHQHQRMPQPQQPLAPQQAPPQSASSPHMQAVDSANPSNGTAGTSTTT